MLWIIRVYFLVITLFQRWTKRLPSFYPTEVFIGENFYYLSGISLNPRCGPPETTKPTAVSVHGPKRVTTGSVWQSPSFGCTGFYSPQHCPTRPWGPERWRRSQPAARESSEVQVTVHCIDRVENNATEMLKRGKECSRCCFVLFWMLVLNRKQA